MKKFFMTIALVAIQLAAVAQTVNVHFKNGQTIAFPSTNVDFVNFSEKAPEPTISAGAVVDLGLSVYWCSCNVGAEAPEEYGDYFAWGETSPKSSYSKNNYAYYNITTDEYTDIGDNISGTEYDAATVNLGSDWRMPTKAELQELLNNCSWEWTQINNINGYKVTAENGNSIFIPASDEYSPYGTDNTKEGFIIWSANKGTAGTQYEYAMALNNSYYDSPNFSVQRPKYYGICIRPVTTNPNAEGGPVDHSNDHLVTDNISAAFTGGSISSINGRIQAGSVLNVKFTNSSSEPVMLIGAEIHEKNGNAGNNVLDAEEEIAAGGSKAFGVSLGSSMTTPVICFTYRYNKKKYTVEATYSSNN